MTSLKLKTGKVMPLILVEGKYKLACGTMRDTLTFKFDPTTVTSEELEMLFANSKLLETLTIIDGDKETVYEGYCVPLSSGRERETIEQGGYTAGEAYADLLVLEVGQMTYAERQAEELQKTTDENTELICDLIGGAI